MTLLSFLFKWFIGIYITWKRLMGKKIRLTCSKIKETFRSGIIKMAITDIIWEMSSHWRSTEITAASCLAPVGLGWIAVGAGSSLPALSLDLCRDCPFVIKLSSEAYHPFEGMCTSHGCMPSALSSLSPYCALQEYSDICKPVQFWLSFASDFSNKY